VERGEELPSAISPSSSILSVSAGDGASKKEKEEKRKKRGCKKDQKACLLWSLSGGKKEGEREGSSEGGR